MNQGQSYNVSITIVNRLYTCVITLLFKIPCRSKCLLFCSSLIFESERIFIKRMSNYQKIKEATIWFWGGGGWQIWSGQNINFQHELGRIIYLHEYQNQNPLCNKILKKNRGGVRMLVQKGSRIRLPIEFFYCNIVIFILQSTAMCMWKRARRLSVETKRI